MATPLDRLAALPRLGVGISAEPDSARVGLDAVRFAAERPGLVHFLEYGTDLERGLDEHARRWVATGRPTTYHFLDLNLEEREDVDEGWLREAGSLARELGAAWICGDAGRWHLGGRERGHQLLLPPVLTRDSALEVADGVLRVEAATGLVCLPENPPAALFLGELHLLDYFALVSDRAACGLLLDCAHLAIFQRLRGLPPTTGLDGFPLDRVVELHVAGGSEIDVDGLALVDDAHGPVILEDTWEILEAALPRATALRALCYECERNAVEEVEPGFARLNALFPPP